MKEHDERFYARIYDVECRTVAAGRHRKKKKGHKKKAIKMCMTADFAQKSLLFVVQNT